MFDGKPGDQVARVTCLVNLYHDRYNYLRNNIPWSYNVMQEPWDKVMLVPVELCIIVIQTTAREDGTFGCTCAFRCLGYAVHVCWLLRKAHVK